MSQSSQTSGSEGQQESPILAKLHEQGVVNLDTPLRSVVTQLELAPGEGKELASILGRLHDQGVVNLQTPLRKALQAVGTKELASLQAILGCNDNFCIVVKRS